MIEAVLNLKIRNNWIADVSKEHPVRIRILDCIPFAKEGGRALLEIYNVDDLNKFTTEIKKIPSVCGINIASLTHSGKNRVLAAVSTSKCVACEALTHSGCFLNSAISSNGELQWKVISVENNSIQKLIKKLEEYHCKVDIIKISNVGNETVLTSKQEENLRVALEKGYFDVPKKISIRELAKILKISISTLSEILRKGEYKILSQYFNGQK